VSSPSSQADLEQVNSLKSSVCRVLPATGDQQPDSKQSSFQTSQPPRENQIQPTNEQFRCTEVLFDPAKFGRYDRGMSEIVTDAIKAADVYARKDLFTNIILSGSSTLLAGLPERLQTELNPKFADRCRVIACPERAYSTWIGGSILASLSTFQGRWISRSEYEEEGPSIASRKCL